MGFISGIGTIAKLGKMNPDLELHNSNYQRISKTLENLKGIKGKEGISKAAKGFESLFIYRMLKEMRKTVPKSSLFGESFGIDIFTSMLDEKIANSIAETQTFGLSEMLIRHLEKKYDIEDKDVAKTGLKREKNVYHHSEGTKTIGLSPESRMNLYLSIINEAAAKYKIDPDLIKAVITQESSGIPKATSKQGAKGLMQLMDTTAEELEVRDVFDPEENIFAGTRHLKRLLVQHKGDLPMALAAYNAGSGAVKLYNGIPPYAETQNFVMKVMKLQHQFRRGE